MESAEVHKSAPAPKDRAVPGRVWGGALLQAAGRVFAALTTFASLALLARAMEPEGFGRYTFYLAVFALLDALTDFGTGAASVQRSSQSPGQLGAVLLAGRATRRRMATLGAVSVGIALLFLDEPDWPWVLAATLYQYTHTLELSATVYKNAVRWSVPVLARCLAAAARLALVLLLLQYEVTSPGVHLVATALGSSLANGVLHLCARAHLPREPVADLGIRSDLWRVAWPLGLAAVCQQGYFYLDNLFVRALAGDGELGRYNAAVRILSFLLLGAQYASLAALPWLTRRRALGDGGAAARLAQPLVLAASFCLGGLIPWCGPMLALGFGESFRSAAPALAWLLCAVVLVHGGAVFLTAAVSFGATRGVLAIAASALLVNAVLNGLFVPSWGIQGAAVATLLTELWVVVGSIATLQRQGARLGAERPLLWLLAPVLFGLGAGLSSLLPGAQWPFGTP